MARTKVVLPPDSTGQAMGVSTYSNGTDTVAAPETVLVSPSGTPITPTTPADTQPVSGTVTANAGSGTFAVDSELTTKDYDSDAGTDTVAVVGLLLPKSGGAVAGGTSTDPIRVDPTGTTAQPITDNGGSLTVDGTVAISGTVAVTDNSGTLSVDDGGGSLTIDGTVGVSGTVTVDSELTTADLDTGAGTDTRAVVGLVYGASGGGTLVSSTNPLPVSDNGGSLTVDGTVTANAGSGTMAVSLAAGATAPAKAEDSASADADVGIPAMGVRKATPANTSGADGDYEMLQMSAGRLWVSATIDAALPAGTAAIGKLAANDGVDVGDVTVNNASGASAVNVQDGGNSLTIDNNGTFAVQAAQSGTWTVQPGNTANTTAWKVDGSAVSQPVVGNAAHDAPDTGNPVLQGYQAVAHGTNPTAVAAADRTVGYANRAGIPFVMGGHPNIITRRDPYTAAQTDTALVTVAAGLKIVVTRVLLTCANSNSVDVSARVGFGTANTPTGAGVVASHPGIPKGGGFNTGDGSGILGIGADNEDLRLTCSIPTGGSIEVVTSYYTIES